MTQSWAFYIQTASSDFMVSISFSSDGAYVLAQLSYGDIVILSASAGTFAAAITPQNGAFSSLFYPYKTLGMNSAGKILFSGTQIALFDISLVGYAWSFYRTGLQTIGIVFGNPDTQYAANFARLAGPVSCYLTLMHLSTGSIFYQNYFTCTNPSYGYLAEKVIEGN